MLALIRRALVLSCLAWAALAAWPAAAGDERWCQLSLSPKSRLRYTLKHKMHTVQGTSGAAVGKVVCFSDGTAQVMVRVDVGTFDSGNANRDAHAKEALEYARFPFVVFKGVVRGALPPKRFPTGPLRGSLEGELELHGVRRQVMVPFTLAFSSPTHATASFQFQVSLEGHGIERPSLLFVKVEDALGIQGDVEFVAE